MQFSTMLFVLLFSGLLGCTSSVGGIPQDDKNVDENFRIIFKEANKNNAEAQFRMGIAYLNGFYGLKENHKVAARLFEQAAFQNHANAQYFLAEMYLSGTGVKQDLVEAGVWLQIASERSDIGKNNRNAFNSALRDKFSNNKPALLQLVEEVNRQISIRKEKIKKSEANSSKRPDPEELPPTTPKQLILATGYLHFIKQMPRFYDHGFQLFMQENPLSQDLFEKMKFTREQVINPVALEEQMSRRLSELLTVDEIERAYIWFSSPLVGPVVQAESAVTTLEGYLQIQNNGKVSIQKLIDSERISILYNFDSPYKPWSNTELQYPAGRIDFATMVALHFRGTTLGAIPTLDYQLDPAFEITEKMMEKHHLTGQATAFNESSKETLRSYSSLVRSNFGRKLTRAIASAFDETIRESRDNFTHNLPDELASRKPSANFRIETAQIVDYGLIKNRKKYREESPGTSTSVITLTTLAKKIEQSELIPATLSVNFGILFQINCNEDAVSVPVKIHLTHPPLTNPATGKTTTVDEWVSKPRSNTPQIDSWEFKEPWEIAPGEWTFSVRTQGVTQDRILLEKTFLVGEDKAERSLAQLEEIDFVFMSKDGRYLAIKERRKNVGEISFWDLATQNIIGSDIVTDWTDIEPAMFSPTKPNIAITKSDGNILTVWDLEDLNNTFNLLETSSPSTIMQRTFGPVGKYFYVVYDTINTSTRRRQTLTKVWDLENRKLIATHSPFMDIAIHPQEKYLAGELYDCSIQIWNLETGALTYTEKREESCRRKRTAIGIQQFNVVQTLLTEQTAIILYADGRCDFVDLQTGKTIKQAQVGKPELWFNGGQKREGGGRFNLEESGQTLIYEPRDRNEKNELWNASTGSKIISYSGIVKFNREGTIAVVFDDATETISTWDMTTRKELFKIKKKGGIDVTISSDFKSFAFVENVYNKTTHREHKSIQIHSLVNNTTISDLQAYNINKPVFRYDLTKVFVENYTKNGTEIIVFDLIKGEKEGSIQKVSKVFEMWEQEIEGQKKVPAVEVENADGTISLIDPFTFQPVRGEHYSLDPSTKRTRYFRRKLNGLHLLDINIAGRSKIISKGNSN